ncbi:hypothetical protein PUN28_020615 [Cardiocondyla obscurior]|uniref:Uncharacterized protein n=1 Tax=Cardiocondyla obscurior TaxID=286306 RepID=A0AAW2E7W0_9HYME
MILAHVEKTRSQEETTAEIAGSSRSETAWVLANSLVTVEDPLEDKLRQLMSGVTAEMARSQREMYERQQKNNAQ